MVATREIASPKNYRKHLFKWTPYKRWKYEIPTSSSELWAKDLLRFSRNVELLLQRFGSLSPCWLILGSLFWSEFSLLYEISTNASRGFVMITSSSSSELCWSKRRFDEGLRNVGESAEHSGEVVPFCELMPGEIKNLTYLISCMAKSVD